MPIQTYRLCQHAIVWMLRTRRYGVSCLCRKIWKASALRITSTWIAIFKASSKCHILILRMKAACSLWWIRLFFALKHQLNQGWRLFWHTLIHNHRPHTQYMATSAKMAFIVLRRGHVLGTSCEQYAIRSPSDWETVELRCWQLYCAFEKRHSKVPQPNVAFVLVCITLFILSIFLYSVGFL